MYAEMIIIDSVLYELENINGEKNDSTVVYGKQFSPFENLYWLLKVAH